MGAIWVIHLYSCSNSSFYFRHAWPVHVATCVKRMLFLPSVFMFSALSVWRRGMTPASANVPSVMLLLVPTISIASTLVDSSQEKKRGWLDRHSLINHQTSTSSLSSCHLLNSLSTPFPDFISRFSSLIDDVRGGHPFLRVLGFRMN